MAKDGFAPHLWSEFMHFRDFAPWTYISLKEIHLGMGAC